MKKHNCKNNFKLLNNWLSSLELNNENEIALKDVHIDELIGEQDNETMFFKSLELFYNLIHLDFDYDFRAHYIPSLYFRLGFISKISFEISENVWEELGNSPPNIYLIPKINLLTGVDIEEYKKPLDFKIFKDFKEDCKVYYSCSRSMKGIKNNCDYFRAVTIDNFGKKFV